MSLRQVLSLSLVLALTACGGSRQDSQTSAVADGNADRIFDGISSTLNASFPAERGHVWTPTRLDLAADWIIQTPEGMWGARPEDVPTEVDCDTSDPRCDEQFQRMSCRTTADCEMPGSQCLPLEATVSYPGAVARKLCLARTDKILDRIHRTMISSRKELDFVSLSMPTGQFRETVINALAYLSQLESPPKIRFLFSAGPKPVIPNFLSSARNNLNSLMNDVASHSYLANRLHVNLAFVNVPTRASWNHAKMIIADGERALTGGHNIWQHVYLSPQPLFDLSMEYRGQAAAAARDFANVLWDLPHSGDAEFPEGSGPIPRFRSQPTTAGKIKAITVGRLGALGANPSELALQALIKLSTTTIRISQQDLYNHVITPLTRSFIEDELIAAAARGVKIQIVQSNNYPLVGGYGSVDGDRVYQVFIDRLAAILRQRPAYTSEKARLTACQLISYAPFRFSRHLDKWDASWLKNTIGTHAKFVMVDDTAFYIGSHNLYPANLQEFGVIVTNSAAAVELKTQYWDKMWAESSTAQFPCPSTRNL